MYSTSQVRDFANKIGCDFLENEPMFNHTTFKTGGEVDFFFSPSNPTQIKEILAYCKENEIPYIVIGRGSNLLVLDEGIRGAVIYLGKNISSIVREGDTLVCGCGADLASVCIFAQKNSLSGMEFAYGIPGSIGGALFMNAGAYGGEMKDIVSSAECIDEQGNIFEVSADEMQLSYRNSAFQKNKYIVLSASLKLSQGDADEIKNKMDETLQKRRDKQPLNYPSAGSTFKRPQGAFAAELIERCGLKGKTFGGAQVSEKHSGFIINRGGATASDILNLIDEVKAEVKQKTGYELECEIKII